SVAQREKGDAALEYHSQKRAASVFSNGRTDHCGLINCSRPSWLTSLSEVLVPRARTWTCVGFDSPPRLTADPSSVAAILTLGALESIMRSSTISVYPIVPSGILTVGLFVNTLIIARTRPQSSTISNIRPRSTDAISA